MAAQQPQLRFQMCPCFVLLKPLPISGSTRKRSLLRRRRARRHPCPAAAAARTTATPILRRRPRRAAPETSPAPRPRMLPGNGTLNLALALTKHPTAARTPAGRARSPGRALRAQSRQGRAWARQSGGPQGGPRRRTAPRSRAARPRALPTRRRTRCQRCARLPPGTAAGGGAQPPTLSWILPPTLHQPRHCTGHTWLCVTATAMARAATIAPSPRWRRWRQRPCRRAAPSSSRCAALEARNQAQHLAVYTNSFCNLHI